MVNRWIFCSNAVSKYKAVDRFCRFCRTNSAWKCNAYLQSGAWCQHFYWKLLKLWLQCFRKIPLWTLFSKVSDLRQRKMLLSCKLEADSGKTFALPPRTIVIWTAPQSPSQEFSRNVYCKYCRSSFISDSNIIMLVWSPLINRRGTAGSQPHCYLFSKC